ncbi:hypothetical protein G7054_g5580 [Neopestalotiopsis clavispora]|nr:hypothetical protein G7054_g5580 [Neopestalotiopsis clavispora]
MSARLVSSGARGLLAASSPMRSTATRTFTSTTSKLADATVALPARKPVGAFRGGLFGFLLGSTLAAPAFTATFSKSTRHRTSF